jgi:hypothetical protein
MGLVSQAGVAIGLATIVAQVYPDRGAEIRTMFLAMIAVNEAMGPVFFRQALARSGELAEEAATAEYAVPPVTGDASGTPATDQAAEAQGATT